MRQSRLKKADFGTNMLGAGLTALGLLALSTLPAGCGGGSGETGPGSGGGTSGTAATTSAGPGGASTSTSSGPATCAGGCGTGEVCSEGACVPVPDHCPCPHETYCDLNTNTCEVGCLGDSDCSSGHYCDTPNRACVVGCREAPSAAAGRSASTISARPGATVTGTA